MTRVTESRIPKNQVNSQSYIVRADKVIFESLEILKRRTKHKSMRSMLNLIMKVADQEKPWRKPEDGGSPNWAWVLPRTARKSRATDTANEKSVSLAVTAEGQMLLKYLQNHTNLSIEALLLSIIRWYLLTYTDEAKQETFGLAGNTY